MQLKYVDTKEEIIAVNKKSKHIEAELDAKGEELGVTFDYADYTFNGQADSTTLNQIASELVADGVIVLMSVEVVLIATECLSESVAVV